jgi:pimeloyl-ACP methyl ester carboxylesterase
MKLPPTSEVGFISLPDTRLHYVRSGEGPPLLIVPATVSLIQQWLPLAQFMGQRFETYFFELPGHGQSAPYPTKFESRLVPNTVAALMDAMGYDTFNLMGFSFGGLLAMRTLEELTDRIENVILLSPCVTYKALKYSPLQQWGFKRASTILKHTPVQEGVIRMLHSGRIDRPMIYALSKASNIEQSILESKNALRIPKTTLDVLAHTMEEIFSLDYSARAKPFQHPCYFGMSIYDDLLDFEITLDVVKDHFENLVCRAFTLPYHQPPEPPTFEWLVKEFGSLLDYLP